MPSKASYLLGKALYHQRYSRYGNQTQLSVRWDDERPIDFLLDDLSLAATPQDSAAMIRGYINACNRKIESQNILYNPDQLKKILQQQKISEAISSHISRTNEQLISKRPTGEELGRLYDFYKTLTDNPTIEINRAAFNALLSEDISPEEFIVLQHRTPFPGFSRKSFNRIGEAYLFKAGTWVSHLEARASRKILRLLEKGNLKSHK